MAKMRYKMSSRTAILLGRESVTRAESAIVELVKNTYDADADFAFIKFDEKLDTLYILDNGIGMTERIIDEFWMTIGTDNKVENYQSNKNRIKSGEKGVGRLSLDRLGEICEMYTKNNLEQLNYWRSDFTDFESPGKLLEEVEVIFEKREQLFIDVIPASIIDDIRNIEDSNYNKVNFDTGTLLIIKNLRDRWTKKKINQLFNDMSFLVPPSEQSEYELLVLDPETNTAKRLMYENSYEFDYKMKVNFNNGIFYVDMYRNEFDLNKIPSDLFNHSAFQKYPFTRKEFETGYIHKEIRSSQLLKDNSEIINQIFKQIGEFKLEFGFMKLSKSQEDKNYYMKEFSPSRNGWMNLYSGIKIYRDNFIIRPYGVVDSSSYDWLGLDFRKSKSPAPPSHKSGTWKVRNKQLQGTLFISRVSNPNIKDIASRESLIENDELKVLKETVRALIEIFEKDRTYIIRNMRDYNEATDNFESTKKNAEKIAKKINNRKSRKPIDYSKASSQKIISLYEETSKENETMAKAIDFYKSEKNELFTEIKLLRELSTSGLITSAIVHDLKTLSGSLGSRSRMIKKALNANEELLNEVLENLQTDDLFLKAWIKVIMNQNRDKRRKEKKDFKSVIDNLVNLLEPILIKKKIIITFDFPEEGCFKRIYETDFNSIFYNLIINSIESFERKSRDERIINISLRNESGRVKIIYSDNGYGLSPHTFKDNNEIFEYGTTCKTDKDGERIGTGLGMYIVATTLNEYEGKYEVISPFDGFRIDILV